MSHGRRGFNSAEVLFFYQISWDQLFQIAVILIVLMHHLASNSSPCVRQGDVWDDGDGGLEQPLGAPFSAVSAKWDALLCMDTEQSQDSSCLKELAILKCLTQCGRDLLYNQAQIVTVQVKCKRLLKSKGSRSGVTSCLRVPLLPSAQEQFSLSVSQLGGCSPSQLAGDAALLSAGCWCSFLHGRGWRLEASNLYTQAFPGAPFTVKSSCSPCFSELISVSCNLMRMLILTFSWRFMFRPA